MSQENLEELQARKVRQEELEHRDVLLAIGAILKNKEGQQLFKYLFKTLDVICDPPPGMEGNILHEYLGHLRAGNSVYKLVCEADFEIAASILSKLERERYDELYEQHNANTTEYNNDNDDSIT